MDIRATTWMRYSLANGDWEYSHLRTYSELIRIARNVDVTMPVKSEKWFDELKSKTTKELLDMGLQKWEGNHWLYPVTWFDYIPDGYVVLDIFGNSSPFSTKNQDDDGRFGMLAFGFTTDA